MLLETPLIITLVMALVLLAVTYTLRCLINNRIEHIRADRQNTDMDEEHSLSLMTRVF
jgi:hypothetical protein